MEKEKGRLLDGNGSGSEADIEPESQEELQVAFKKLTDLTRTDGSLVSMTKQDLSLMQWILRAVSEEHKEEAILSMWRMCSFEDKDEALDHVAAYYEAKDLGMDTGFNVAFMFSLTSVNKPGPKNNLMAQLMDTMQHGKWADTNQKGKVSGNKNPRSPLSS